MSNPREITLSFIIPVYNRPQEIQELLESMAAQEGGHTFEVVIIEDGSEIPSTDVIQKFNKRLHITYLQKPNTGPGDSRNFGMQLAHGNYFIILDSDCLLPPHYVQVVMRSLSKEYIDCYGGPDAAHPSFSDVQKAINYVMTSPLTTGGIRGGKTQIDKFQPRSFNMGLSKKAFVASKGFGNIHPGEDPDLVIRLWKLGFKTKLITEAFVFHKRRIDWGKFKKQVYKFGSVRPILNHWHPHTRSIVYWFPIIFIIGFIISIVAALFGFFLPVGLYSLFVLIIFLGSWYSEKKITIGLFSVFALFIQFSGYAYGFLKSTLKILFTKKAPEELFPEFFFIPNQKL